MHRMTIMDFFYSKQVKMIFNTVKIESDSFIFSDIASEDSEKKLIALFNSKLEVQEKALNNPIEFANYVRAFTNADIQSLFKLGHLTSYLIHFGSLFSTHSLYNHSCTLQFFLVVIEQIVKKGAIPWSLISGRSFLGHMKELSSMAPSEMGFKEYLMNLGEHAISVFEEIVRKKAQISSMTIDSKEKINRLNQLHNDAYFLEERGFPGAREFIDDLKQEIEEEKNRLEQAERLFQEMQQPLLSKIEKAKLLDKELDTYQLRAAFIGNLIMRSDFQAISTFLDSMRSAKDCASWIFQAICLEKVQNIELPIVCLETAIESLACIWNLYYQSPNSIFRNEKLFTLEQQNLIDQLIQEKVITLLFSYMATAREDALSQRVSENPSIPSSLHLITKGKNIFLPLNVFYHQMGLLITPTLEGKASCSIFNTGVGVEKNHPTIKDGKKVQTVVRKHNVPTGLLFNEEIWTKIQKMRCSQDVNMLYSLILDVLCAEGEKEGASEDCHDYESPQHMGSCTFQHMQALIRDQFMTCDQLGSKKMRYAAYRIIISDFALFVGDISFQMDQHELIDQNQSLLLQAWEEKKSKLQAILGLVKAIDRYEMPKENVLEYICAFLDSVKNIQGINKVASNLHDEAFQYLKQASTLYRDQLRERAIQRMTEMALEELPATAALNIRRTDFVNEIFAIVKERMAEHPLLMEKFKTHLSDRNIHWTYFESRQG